MRQAMTATALGAVVFVVALANRPAMIMLDDVVPQMFEPWMLVRGAPLDFAPIIARYGDPQAPSQGYLVRAGDRVLSIYPYAAGWLPTPISVPQLLYFDAATPGWDRNGATLLPTLQTVGKRTSATIVALTAMLLCALLRQWGLGGWAWPATLVTALGSDLWMVASQATWQHGPAALCLVASLLALSPTAGKPLVPTNALLGGLFAGLLIAVRLPDAVLAVGLVFVAWRRSGIRAFLIGVVPVIALLVVWNQTTFGTPLGGQAVLAGQVATTHRVAWFDVAARLEGWLGTLVSPSRGLLVFSPWCVAVLAAPFARDFDRRARGMLWALLAFGLMIGSYPAWWAGHCFGPRYWTEAMPLFAAPLAWCLRASFARAKPLFVLLMLACAWSIAVQALGAVCYPSTWNVEPANVDHAHERLWDVRECELTRCWLEGPTKAGSP